MLIAQESNQSTEFSVVKKRQSNPTSFRHDSHPASLEMFVCEYFPSRSCTRRLMTMENRDWFINMVQTICTAGKRLLLLVTLPLRRCFSHSTPIHNTQLFRSMKCALWVDCVRARIFSRTGVAEWRRLLFTRCDFGWLNCTWITTSGGGNDSPEQSPRHPCPPCRRPISFPHVNHPSRTQNIGFFIDFVSLYLLNNYCCFSSRCVHFGGFFCLFFRVFVSLNHSRPSTEIYIKKSTENRITKKKHLFASRVLCLKFSFNRARNAQPFGHTNGLACCRRSRVGEKSFSVPRIQSECLKNGRWCAGE